MMVTATEVTPNLVMSLTGHVLLATDADPARAERGYDVRLAGLLTADGRRTQLWRFDLIAVGDHWGDGDYNRGARPGRTPFGIAIGLTGGGTQADQVPPGGARTLQEYLSPPPK
jgi:hypothetical protein